MTTVLITGANRGIGLALARHYAGEGARVHATCRRPAAAEELRRLSGDVNIHALDTTHHDEIATLAETIDEAVDIVIANAGIYGPDRSRQSFVELDADTVRMTMEVNLIGTIKTLQAFLPHTRRSQEKKLVAISSKVGSIADASGGAIAYRMSKTALNMAMCCAAYELKGEGIAVGTLHPGWVRTDMGGPNALIDPDESARGLVQVIRDLKPGDKATYKDYKGEDIPW
ncbi:SDR family oxidoreductase [Parvularcula lutaonensis]|uniref:SDR family oxidoreductase n=1 Tax=Parvularcula lutaonensis TaxID=491923 RepID=A0ABV7MAH8_9PROT|nr:SDR family oxidoreductase [Parvularcula lutaonensis]GGY47030.1 short-chain dehydrogenase [Parvularcula lutaonensis]